jgi:hypothetical protein
MKIKKVFLKMLLVSVCLLAFMVCAIAQDTTAVGGIDISTIDFSSFAKAALTIKFISGAIITIGGGYLTKKFPALVEWLTEERVYQVLFIGLIAVSILFIPQFKQDALAALSIVVGAVFTAIGFHTSVVRPLENKSKT